jgi:hypothetical protein
MTTVRPVIGANRSDGDVVTATDWNRDIVQQGNWAQEVLLGTNTDKIPAVAIAGSVGYYPNVLVNGGMEVCQRFAPNTNQTITTGGVVVLDRWVGIITGAAAMTVAQSTAAADAGSQYSAYIVYIQRPTAEELLLCRRYYQKFATTTRWRTSAAGEARDTGIVWPTPMAGTPTTTLTSGGNRNNIASASLLSVDANGARVEYIATATTTDTWAIGDVIEAVYNI